MMLQGMFRQLHVLLPCTFRDFANIQACRQYHLKECVQNGRERRYMDEERGHGKHVITLPFSDEWASKLSFMLSTDLCNRLGPDTVIKGMIAFRFYDAEGQPWLGSETVGLGADDGVPIPTCATKPWADVWLLERALAVLKGQYCSAHTPWNKAHGRTMNPEGERQYTPDEYKALKPAYVCVDFRTERPCRTRRVIYSLQS